MSDRDATSTGSVATRRRAALRLHARHRRIAIALAFLVDLIDAAQAGKSRYSRHLASTLIGGSSHDGGCRSDILPLPRAEASWLQLPCISTSACADQLCHLVNASVSGLNYLNSNFKVAAPAPRPSNAQRHILQDLAVRWWRLGRHLHMAEVDEGIHDAFSALVGKGMSPQAMPLRAECVDMPAKCAVVTPEPFLPKDIIDTIHNPLKLFPDGVAAVCEELRYRGGARAEYIMLLRRQARVGKVVFRSSVQHAAPVFAVRKGTTARQREVWNGGPLSTVTAEPPPPPSMANPSASVVLECSDDMPLWLSTRDGAAFFDQLRLPEELREYVARPSVRIDELCSGDYKGGVHPDQGPMTSAEIATFCTDPLVDTSRGDLTVWPCSTVWPMGHSWSSSIAQHTMVGTCKRAGLSSDQFLAGELTLPDAFAPAVAVATDDINLFERGSREHGPMHESALHRLDVVWRECGIVEKTEKRVDRSLTGSMLGMQLVNGTHLLPKGSRLSLIVQSLTQILREPLATPSLFRSFLRSLQWIMLANRPTLTAFTAVYRFSFQQPDTKVLRLPEDALDELRLLATILCTLVIDLRRDWAPYVLACDGAPSYGYGGCKAATTPADTRDVARNSGKCPHRIIPLDGLSHVRSDPHAHIILRRMSDFKTIFSVRCKPGLHASCVEMGALDLTLRNITRHSRGHKKRITVLTDSLAVLYSVRKGRTSAPNLVPGMRVAALVLACDLKLRMAYIPSRWNPADADSRGQKRRSEKSRSERGARLSHTERRLHELSRSVRRLIACGHMTPPDAASRWTSSCSSSCLGQPRSE